jgi:hypothetical protein
MRRARDSRQAVIPTSRLRGGVIIAPALAGFAHAFTTPKDTGFAVVEPQRENGHLEATFCLRRRTTDDRWHTGVIDLPTADRHRTDPDGSGLLSILFDGSGEAYRSFAPDYYEAPIGHAAVTHVFALRPLTQHVVSSLNPELTLDQLTDELQRSGEPGNDN